jgi:hypothetical protein
VYIHIVLCSLAITGVHFTGEETEALSDLPQKVVESASPPRLNHNFSLTLGSNLPWLVTETPESCL